MATIYFANYKKRQLGNFLNKYPCIIMLQTALNVISKVCNRVEPKVSVR